jgi:hypothetical protein
VKKVRSNLKASLGGKNATDLLPRLSRPAQRALASAGIQRLKELTKFSEAEIKKLHGNGPNALVQLRGALKAAGMSFSDRH